MNEISCEYIKATLATIWFNVLGVDPVENDSNYFELGGDSMAAVLILNDIYKLFNIKMLLEEFSLYRTFGAQVENIVNKTKSKPCAT